ncbi:hypothetical protein MSAN_01414100 [Mycena sanguinolenta]|uniref:Uncharacterized protein n=1 Tax=Mycena sanguinolenta TaxID=230812 RepID=A0A8H7D0T7_9AGAR|nr:hypothetical protein MSAN_01414100 [Mycena sanguinolenta]
MPSIIIKSALKPWLAVEALPLVALVGGMVSFASYFTARSAMGPTISPVQWTKKNSEPWNSIRPDQGVKMVQVNQKFDNK